MIAVSKCLAGCACRYDGKAKSDPEVMQLVKEGRAVPVCPEQAGGLSTPRLPSEIREGRVYHSDGTDVTAAFEKGADICLEEVLQQGCTEAILMERSPSCGVHAIYDGSFKGKLIPGCGIFTRKLIKAGILCRSAKVRKQDE